jgi:hypothetical protein
VPFIVAAAAAANEVSFIADTFHINPQLHLILSEMEEVIVSLNQHSIMEPKVQLQ